MLHANNFDAFFFLLSWFYMFFNTKYAIFDVSPLNQRSLIHQYKPLYWVFTLQETDGFITN